jgi:hypothetical protein
VRANGHPRAPDQPRKFVLRIARIEPKQLAGFSWSPSRRARHGEKCIHSRRKKRGPP